MMTEIHNGFVVGDMADIEADFGDSSSVCSDEDDASVCSNVLRYDWLLPEQKRSLEEAILSKTKEFMIAASDEDVAMVADAIMVNLRNGDDVEHSKDSITLKQCLTSSSSTGEQSLTKFLRWLAAMW